MGLNDPPGVAARGPCRRLKWPAGRGDSRPVASELLDAFGGLRCQTSIATLDGLSDAIVNLTTVVPHADGQTVAVQNVGNRPWPWPGLGLGDLYILAGL